MSNPMFSIIIPAYNAEGHIRKALDSIVCQTYKNYELIVVCDSCTDNTEEIAKSYGAKTLTVNYGTDGLTRDAGIKIATGDWIMFMDDDDWWLHEYVLQQLFEVIGRHDEDVFAFGYIAREHGYVKQSMKTINCDQCVNVWSKCFRRTSIGNARFGITKYCSDRIFLRKFMKNVKKIVFWDMPMYYYNWMRPGSQTYRMNNGDLDVHMPFNYYILNPEMEEIADE